jgi:hypothetical protein
MKKLLFGALALTVLATACKKKDDNGTPSNTFSVDGKSFSVVAGSFNATNGTVSVSGLDGATGGTMIFEFPGTTNPTAGTYKVVKSESGTPAAGQVSFVATNMAKAYASTGAGTVNATVTVDGGKISVSMPDAPASESGATTSVNVKANIKQ